MKLEFSRQIFEKKDRNNKFHENPSSGSQVVPCGQTDTQTRRQTDMKKLIATFRHFTSAPKIVLQVAWCWVISLCHVCTRN